MKKILLFAFLILAAGTFFPVYGQLTVTIIKTGEDGGVDISFDDGEYENDSIDKLYDDDLDMGWEGEDLNIMTTFLRFQDVIVPKASVIDSAFLNIYAHEDESDEAKIHIQAEAADNSQVFTESEALNDRTWTSASVNWTITDEWTMWQPYRSPELKTVIQEIVNRPGWVSGNALTIFLQGEDQGASLLDNARDFESFENIEDPDDGGDGLHHPERNPVLTIYFDSTPTSVKLSRQEENIIVQADAYNGTLTILCNAEVPAAYEIFNITGSKVHDGKLNSGQAAIDISGFTHGIYLVNIIQSDNTYTRKIALR